MEAPVHLGFLKSLTQDGFVGIVTAAKPVAVSVSVCLSLISGGPFGVYCILLYLVGVCVWGGCPHGCVGTFRNFTKVMFSCLWWAPSPPLPQALGVGLLLLLVISGLGEARLLWGTLPWDWELLTVRG